MASILLFGDCFVSGLPLPRNDGSSMCFTIPQKIKKAGNQKAITADNDVLDSSLVSIKIGDWVLAQNNFVIAKISAAQARNIITITKTAA